MRACQIDEIYRRMTIWRIPSRWLAEEDPGPRETQTFRYHRRVCPTYPYDPAQVPCACRVVPDPVAIGMLLNTTIKETVYCLESSPTIAIWVCFLSTETDRLGGQGPYSQRDAARRDRACIATDKTLQCWVQESEGERVCARETARSQRGREEG